MHRIGPLILTAALLGGPSAGDAGGAVQAETFKARLTPVPIDAANAASITGHGSATAELAGTRLTIEGTFEGLQSAATVGRLHHGAKGVRGPARFDLTVTSATSGRITATCDLSAAQVEELQKGRFYLQIHSEGAPDGNLWGWLLPQER